MKIKTVFRLCLISIFFVLFAETNSVRIVFAEEGGDLELPNDYVNPPVNEISNSVDFTDYTSQISNMPGNPVVSYAPNESESFSSGAMPAVPDANGLTNYMNPPELTAPSLVGSPYADSIQRSTEDWGKIATNTAIPNTFENQEYLKNKNTPPNYESGKQRDENWNRAANVNGALFDVKKF